MIYRFNINKFLLSLNDAKRATVIYKEYLKSKECWLRHIPQGCVVEPITASHGIYTNDEQVRYLVKLDWCNKVSV